MIIIFAHVVRPYVRPHFSNLAYKTTENNGRWIIDDSCLVISYFFKRGIVGIGFTIFSEKNYI